LRLRIETLVPMTYEQALAFWYGRINFEHKSPTAGDFKLDRMRALLRALGNPHERLRIIHVAGSKGKGSTSAMLASILRCAGYRTGLFTSPHLVRVEERIQVDNQLVTSEELTILLEDVRTAIEKFGLEPTFFEVATALGFLHFVRRRVDVAVLEVGLGGRLDSTNVCHPLVAVITSISHDHTQVLGSTLARIAAEKAGIIKCGRPVVSGVTVAEARDVIARICTERLAPIWQLGEHFRYSYRPGRVTADETRLPSVDVELHAMPTAPSAQCSELELSLLGEHQAANAAVAVAVITYLRSAGLHVPDVAVRAGLSGVQWPARLELIGRRPLVVLDCAHNVASSVALVQTLETSFPPVRRWLLFAGSSDKDLAGMFRVLAPHFHQAFLTAYRSGTRSVPPEQLAAILRQVADLPYTMHATAEDAWHAAQSAAEPNDLICITGSVFLAGELRPLLTASSALLPQEEKPSIVLPSS
jgi:dihydrofolate synthase/folylpolyglutamate synthase